MELFKVGFISVGIIDLVDILVVAIMLYKLYRIFRQTAMVQVLVLFLLVFIVWRVVELLDMELLKTIMREFIQIGTIAVVVIFSPEIRRFLTNITRNTLFDRLRKQISENLETQQSLNEIVAALEELSANRTGALIVLQGNNSLDSIIETGDEINASVSKRLLASIFNPKSPLHDGAVVIKDGLIKAARVVLPISDDPDIPPELGLRHRSGLGISEISDAASIICSEETGKISVANEGRLKRNVSSDELTQFLKNFYNISSEEEVAVAS